MKDMMLDTLIVALGLLYLTIGTVMIVKALRRIFADIVKAFQEW